MELNIETPRVYLPLLQPARYKGVYGGRGSGKSHFFAELMIEAHIMNKTDSVCVREHQKSLQQSVKKLLENKIEKLNAGAYFEIQDKRILAVNGGLIIFEGMQNHTAESIKSLEGYDRAWVEEAQTMSQKSLDMLRPTIRKPRSELWFSWNPRNDTDPVDVLLRSSSPPPNSIVIEANYEHNPWFPDVLTQEMEYDRSRDPDKYAHVWLGEYVRNSEARVFKNWKIEECEPDNASVFRFGADWGFSIDPSVLLRAWIDGKTLYVDYEAYMVGCEIDNLPELFMSVPDAEKWPIVADNARPETISYMRRNGFPKILSAVKGPRSLEEGIEFLKSYNIVVHPRCTHLIDELTIYCYKKDAQTNQIIPILEDKDNHCIDALRYACEGVRRAQKTQKSVQRKIIVPHGTSTSWMG
jgi:phage terminase large subunit